MLYSLVFGALLVLLLAHALLVLYLCCTALLLLYCFEVVRETQDMACETFLNICQVHCRTHIHTVVA